MLNHPLADFLNVASLSKGTETTFRAFSPTGGIMQICSGQDQGSE
jgi:hypothetical protein